VAVNAYNSLLMGALVVTGKEKGKRKEPKCTQDLPLKVIPL
jgi:hypothetical protein